jgi:hypothetical protein
LLNFYDDFFAFSINRVEATIPEHHFSQMINECFFSARVPSHCRAHALSTAQCAHLQEKQKNVAAASLDKYQLPEKLHCK